MPNMRRGSLDAVDDEESASRGTAGVVVAKARAGSSETVRVRGAREKDC